MRGEPPLHLACRIPSSAAVLAALLERGADPSERCAWGFSAWDRATAQQSVSGIDPLAMLGGVPRTKAVEGGTPTDLAALPPGLLAAVASTVEVVTSRDRAGFVALGVDEHLYLWVDEARAVIETPPGDPRLWAMSVVHVDDGSWAVEVSLDAFGDIGDYTLELRVRGVPGEWQPTVLDLHVH